jgi:hypothetical protein
VTTTNAARCRAYYERVKQDHVKHQARIAKISENRRRRHAASRAGHVKQSEAPLARSPLLVERNHVKPTPFEAPLAAKHVKQPAGEPEAREAPLDLDYEERAAIMEYDGGLTRVEAEFEAALRSTDPLVPVVSTPVVSSLGGKHAATAAQGDIGLTADQIMEIWRQHWGA